MTASNQPLLGYYTEHCHPQLRGQTVFVQLADQSTDFKRDAMPQVIDFPPSPARAQNLISFLFYIVNFLL